MNARELKDLLTEAVNGSVSVYITYAPTISGYVSWGSGNTSAAGIYSRVVLEGDPNDPRLLATALHEAGHVNTPETATLEGRGWGNTRAVTILDETRAWSWAIDYAHENDIDLSEAWTWAFGSEEALGSYLLSFRERITKEIEIERYILASRKREGKGCHKHDLF